MAIISGILFSKARKSLGNVTLATVKGRVIAKEKATVVSNPKTDKQMKNRNFLAVAVYLWQIVGIVVKDGITRTSAYGSSYNRFVTNVLPWIRIHNATVDTVGDFAFEGVQLTEGILPAINVGVVADAGEVTFQVAKASLIACNAKVGDKINAVVYSQNDAKTYKTTRVLTAQDLAAIEVILTVICSNTYDTAGTSQAVYFVSADGKVSSSSTLDGI